MKFNQKTLSRLLLVAGGIAALGMGAIYGFLLPVMLRELRVMVPVLATPTALYAALLFVLYACALYLYARICLRIGQEQSFTEANAIALRRIGRLLFGAAAVWLLGELFTIVTPIGPAVYYLILLAMANGAMGLLAWTIGQLVRHAARLQEENDLTV